MGFYIGQQGNYYEGDKADHIDIEVPQRPSYLYKWVDGEWVIDAEKQAAETKVTTGRQRSGNDPGH